MCVFERIPAKRFLLEGRQTAVETVVWQSRKRESERQRGKERWMMAGW